MAQNKIIQSKSELDSVRKSIKNIILDFGGVLFDIDYQRPIAEFKKLGLLDFDKLYQKSNQSGLFDLLETGKITEKEFVSEIQKLADISLDAQKIIDAWNSILIGIDKERVQKVHALKKEYNLYLLSNTNEIHVSAFEKMVEKEVGLTYFKSAFLKVYYSNEIQLKKPDPETFLQVCHWNNLNPKETLFIDDSIQHVLGAAEAGLYACHLDLSTTDFVELFHSW